MDFNDRAVFEKYFAKIPDKAEIIPSFIVPAPPPTLEELLSQLDKYIDNRIKEIMHERKQLSKRWSVIDDDKAKSQLKHAKANDLIKRVNAWLDSTENQLALPGKTTQIYEYMESFKSSGESDDLSVLIRDVVDYAQRTQGFGNLKKSIFRSLLLQYIRAQLAGHDLSSMQLDDVIALINNTLCAGGVKAKQLRSMITRSYPVCMVDEFQDTDPAQFEMFNQLYEATEGTAFFMVGDPKQSIYGFRGADIFSYLEVRSQVQKQQDESHIKESFIFSLDTNFRSKQALVDATNRLFSEQGQATFLFPGILFIDVKSCEDKEYKQDKGFYKPGYSDLPDKALVFIGNDTDVNNKEKWDGDSLRWAYAQDSAQRIALLLDHKKPTTITLPDKPERTLRGGDIAVLVRSAREAGVMRDALLAQTPRIGSVFQSQRDSVFSSSLIAGDIYHVLRAMDGPKDKNLLKSAMVTLLYRGFSLDFADLDALDVNSSIADIMFESLLEEFANYQKCWDTLGVLPALNYFIEHHKIIEKIALLPDADRLLTDLRHLGEILQKRYLECSSREELLIWYQRQLTDDGNLEEDSKRIRLESDENLVKIVTIHVSKGLEYPVVFLPFFFMPWQVDIKKNLPLYHAEPDYHSRVDFSSSDDAIEHAMKNEMLAEDMRLLYVAITRAIYQCYIGVSAAVRGRQKTPLFPDTVWNYLLNIKDTVMPDWNTIKVALQNRIGQKKSVAYQSLFDLQDIVIERNGSGKISMQIKPGPTLVTNVSLPVLKPSNWVITSYSALVNTKMDPGAQHGGQDELLPLRADLLVESPMQDEKTWMDNIRYSLQRSSNTGECLHNIYEQLALDPSLDMDILLQNSLRNYGLEKPEGMDFLSLNDDKKLIIYQERRQRLMQWFNEVLSCPLLSNDSDSSLRTLFLNKCSLPELDFDFSLGAPGSPVNINESINALLARLDIAGVHVPFHNELEGLMTGSIDLLFIYRKKVYLLDYKSNTLGKAPRFYDQANMCQAMKDHRYDLQYLIYSVAAHRYMQQRLQQRYRYDAGEYSFGGVFYLFLRGMGLPEYPDHGVWFQRPLAEHILALDAAFKGKTNA